MKLYELINFNPVNSATNTDKFRHKLTTNTNARKIGSGTFGTAFNTQSGKRLNQITKVGDTGKVLDIAKPVEDVEDDGYLAYLNAVYKSKSNNPYFPKIHDLKIRKASDGRLSYRTNIEKLIPLASGKIIDNLEMLESIYSDMFNDDPWELSMLSFTGKIEYAIEHRDFKNIKDPKLKEALELILKLLKSGRNFMLDIHSQNCMWRMTGMKPQFVIIDPIA
jgi:hypothetical protein